MHNIYHMTQASNMSTCCMCKEYEIFIVVQKFIVLKSKNRIQ